jgi:hypothetical protein
MVRDGASRLLTMRDERGATDMQNQADIDDIRLKEFLSFFAGKYRPAEKLLTEALAPAALRDAVSDCMDMSLQFTPMEVAKFDSELRLNDIPSLSELRRRYSRTYARVLKRDRIEDETEYYLLRNVLFDPGEKAEGEREQLERLIAEFEKK